MDVARLADCGNTSYQSSAFSHEQETSIAIKHCHSEPLSAVRNLQFLETRKALTAEFAKNCLEDREEEQNKTKGACSRTRL